MKRISNLEGLEIFSASATSVLSSTFSNNVDAGIDEEWSSDSSFGGNYLNGNSYGYFGWHTLGTYLFGNQLKYNESTGANFSHSTLFLVDSNDASHNERYGVSPSSTIRHVVGS